MMVNNIAAQSVSQNAVTPRVAAGMRSPQVAANAQPPAQPEPPAKARQSGATDTAATAKPAANKRQVASAARAVVADLKSTVQQVQRQLEFRVDEDTGETIITVKDAKTGEIVRQIPPQEIIEIGQRLKKLAESQLPKGGFSGLLIQKRA